MTSKGPLPAVRTAQDVTERIREQNDRFRTALGVSPGLSGRVVITHSVAALDPLIQTEVYDAVKAFDAFEPGVESR